MLFPTIGWPTTSALAANLAYLYTLPLCTFFSSLYYNVVIQSTSLQHCDTVEVITLATKQPHFYKKLSIKDTILEVSQALQEGYKAT